MTGDLRIFVNGLDQAGNPLELDDYKTMATVTTAVDTYMDSDPELTIKDILPNEPLMSLALVTDYSGSIKIADLDRIAAREQVPFSTALALNTTFEAAVFNFSNNVDIRQDWTERPGSPASRCTT